MMINAKRILAAMALGACITGVPSMSAMAASSGTDAAKLVPDNIRARGYVTMATDATYAPYEYYSADGKLVGFDIDVAEALGKAMGLKMKYQNIPFDSIIPGVKAGKYDFSMSAFSITKTRAKVIDFIGPYAVSGSNLIVKGGNPLELTLDPLTMCGHAIGAEAATTQANILLPAMSKTCTDNGKKPIVIKTFKNQNQANLAVVSGRVAGVVADAGPAAYQAKLSDGAFEIAPGMGHEPPASYHMLLPKGIVVAKKSPIEPALKAALTTIKADGVLKNLKKKWFKGKYQ